MSIQFTEFAYCAVALYWTTHETRMVDDHEKNYLKLHTAQLNFFCKNKEHNWRMGLDVLETIAEWLFVDEQTPRGFKLPDVDRLAVIWGFYNVVNL